MTQTHSRAQKPAFGRVKGGGAPSGRYRAPQLYSPPSASPPSSGGQHNSQYDNSQYAEILGHGFSGNADYAGGGATHLRPVKGKRFLSGLIDFCIVSVFGAIIVTLQYGVGAGLPELLNGGLLNYLFWYGLVCFIYGFSMEASAAQGTVGKLATGTIVVNENGQRMTMGQAFGRNVGKMATYIVPFYIGYLMVLWTQKNQSLHDKMAGTIVCSKNGVPTSFAETFA